MNVFKRVGLPTLLLLFGISSVCQEISLARMTDIREGRIIRENSLATSVLNSAHTSSITSLRIFACPGNNFTFIRNICEPLALTCETDAIGFTSIKWDFGDGYISTGIVNPTHNYAAFGNYYVTLFLAYPGCADTITKRISVDVMIDQGLVTTPDTIICAGTGMQLRTIPGLSFCWTPTLYLDDPESSTPTSSPPSDITYYFRADVKGNNLVPNGDFSLGNTGFTSDYTYSPASGIFEGNYNVGNNVGSWQPSFAHCNDHTSGTGNMMMVNGSNLPSTSLWSANVAVNPNTNYDLSGWVQNLTSPSPASLVFYVNGERVSSPVNAGANVCDWKQFKGTWSSAASTTALISIVNETIIPEGNDFAIDDISFTARAVVQDSVKIIVEKPLVKTNADTMICARSSIQLNTTGGQVYSWTPVAGLSNPSVANPVASPDIATAYIVTGTTASGCSSKDTVLLGIRSKPPIAITPDTVVCRNGSVQLMISGGTGYAWSPAATLSNPNGPNPVASPTSNTMYYVNFKDTYTCDFIDSVEVNIKPDPVFTVSGPRQVCIKDSIQLVASGGTTYSWQPATGLNDTSVPNPIASPLTSTQYIVTISESTCNYSASIPVMINVMPLPTIVAAKTNDLDCSVDQSQLTASGGQDYQWSPATSLNNANIQNPVARPTVTTDYAVTGTDEYGCTGYDTVTVKVEGTNEGQFLMPSAFTPNNDGINDCFGIRYWGVVEKLEFSIFDRWGQRIFFTSNPQQCWDGTLQGKRQDNGVYVYYIKAKTFCAESVVRKGSFTLIR